jgi:hypothetical protein
MAWLSNNVFTPTDKLHATDLNNLANDIRNWGGDVNGGGFNLYNCTISGVFTDPTTTVGDLIVHGPTAGTVGALQRLPIAVGDGLALVIDHTQALGVKWGVAAQGMLDPTVTKGDLIVKPSGAPPTRLPVGADSHILICDSSQATGLRWGTITGFAAPGNDKQVMLNQAGVPGASANFIFDYSKGHLLIGGAADDGSAAVVQVTGITHTTLQVRTDQFISTKGASSLNVPDAGYGGIGYQGGSTYWYWNGGAFQPVNFDRLATALSDPTTTLGDLIVRGSSIITRFAVGPSNYMLVADSTQPLGLRWQAPPAIGVTSAFGRTGAVVAQAGDYNVSMIPNAVDATQAYVNPTWITSLPWSKITAAPLFLVDPTTAKGDLITRTTSGSAPLTVGSNGQQLTADSTAATGLRWVSPSTMVVTSISPGMFSGAVIFTAGANIALSQISNSSGQQIQISVPNINSSTGMADPTTSQGDLIVHGLTAGTTRMPLGTSGQILTIDTTQDLGMKWAAPAAFVGVTSFSPGALTGAVTLVGGSNVLISQSGQNITVGVPNVMVDPMTTKGDLVAHGTATTRLPVGTDGQSLLADSTQALGVRWGAATGSQTPWASDIDAANHNLANANAVGATQVTVTNNASAAGFTSSGLAPVLILQNPAVTMQLQLGLATANGQYGVNAGDLMFGMTGTARGNIHITSNYSGGGALTNLILQENGGKVGIGTTTPTEALDVNGHLRLRYVTGLGAGGWLDNSTAAEQCFVGLNAAVNTWRVYSALAGVGYNRLAVNLDPTVLGVATVSGDANTSSGAIAQAQLQIVGSSATGNNNKVLFVGFDTSNNYGVIQAEVSGTGWSPLLLNPNGGNVGCGTTAPLKALHAAGNFGAFYGQIRAEALTAGNGAGIDFHATHVGTSGQEAEIQYADNSVGIDLYRKRLVISSFANGAAGQGSMGVAVSLQGGSEGTQDFRITNANNLASTVFTVSQTGNVGIGTSVPSAPLNIYGPGTANNYYANGDAIGATLYLQESSNIGGGGGQILFGSGYGVFGMIKGILQNGTGPAGDLVFGTRASSGNVIERMRVTNAGNVGIGISNPTYNLQVNSSGASAIFGLLCPSGYGSYLELGPTGSTVEFQGSAAGDLYLGFFGVVAGVMLAKRSGSVANTLVLSAGKVGIGTASPAYAVDVAGDINITGTYRVNGTPLSTGGGGVTSVSGGTGISASPTTGAVTVTNTGVTSIAATAPITASASTGGVTLGWSGVQVNNASGGAIGTRPILQFTAGGSGFTCAMGDSGTQINITYSYSSDLRLKQNVRPLEGGLSVVNRLRPVAFEWNGLGGKKAGQHCVAVIAQELKDILPGCVESIRGKLRPEVDADPVTDLLCYDPIQILHHAVLALQQVDKRLKELEEKTQWHRPPHQ